MKRPWHISHNLCYTYVMDFEIIVRSVEDGTYLVSCPNFPACEASGKSVEEAVDNIINKIADTVSGNIRKHLKTILRQIPQDLAEKKGAVSLHGVMTEIPISLN